VTGDSSSTNNGLKETRRLGHRRCCTVSSVEPGASSIWRNRDVGLVVSGATINSVGDWLLELALPLYVFSETRSGITTAMVYLVGVLVSSIFGPLGGRFADSWRLKPTLIATNVLQAIALLPLLAVTGDRIWPVFVVVVVQGLIKAVNDPAGFALLPRLVDDDQLVAANSALSAGTSISRLVGAAAGGFALEFGGLTAVVIADGVTFLVSAAAMAMLSAAADVDPPMPEGSGDDQSVRAGVQILRAVPGMNAIFAMQGLSAVVFGGFPLLFIVFVTEFLNGSESDVGLIRAAPALAGFLAAAVVGTVASRVEPARLMSASFLAFGVVAGLFVNASVFTTALLLYVVLYGATGFPNVASGVGMQSTIQQICPSHVLGRVGGVSGAVYGFGIGLGSILAGVGLELTSARVLLNAQAAMLFACGVIGFAFVVQQARTSAST